jgi:ornithine cyclodeaminase
VGIPFIDADEVARRLPPAAAADAVEAALRGGLDPEGEPPRTVLAAGAGQLLVMPSVAAGPPVVKLVTVGGEPRVQGVVAVFDPDTLAPAALVDGIALTNLRTAAVSAVAVRHLAPPGARRLLVFGAGPQARAHVAALRADRTVDQVDLVGRDRRGVDVDRLVAAADLICCCTTARTPLFDGALVGEGATVVAIGAHEADARETDDALVGRATVVVESRSSALREAGDIVSSIASGALEAGNLRTLAELVRGEVAVDPARPRFFKSTGMSWEDAVVASAVVGLGGHW